MAPHPERYLAFSLLVVLFLSQPVLACGCAEQSLTAYFQKASVVFMGRLLGVEEPAGGEGSWNVRFLAAGRPFKGEPDAFTYRTASSTAGCGIDISVPSRLYLVFGEGDPQLPGIAHVSTCNGTRSFDPASPGGMRGFADVPAREVLTALIRLSATAPTDPPAAGGVPSPDSLVGLVELPGVFNREGEESPSRPPYQPLTLFSGPDPGAPVVGKLAGEADVLTRESGYEVAAAAVFEARDGWLRLRAADGRYGWLQPPGNGVYTPLEQLLVGRLAYLTGDWDGRLWPDPGAGDPWRPVLSEAVRDQPPIEVEEARWVSEGLWFRIRLLQRNPCDGPGTNPAETGWVPAWTEGGHLTSWYWSRGC